MNKKEFTNCFLIETDNNGNPARVCLAMKKRGFGKGMWNGSGGKLKEGETVKIAAEREVEEELGVVVKNIEQCGEIEFYLEKEKLVVLMYVFKENE